MKEVNGGNPIVFASYFNIAEKKFNDVKSVRMPFFPVWSFKLIVSAKSIFLVIACLSSSVTLTQQQNDSSGEAGDSVSFVNKVAPIIVAKCGKCHVSSSKGKYGIESYDALMKSGSITPSDPADSNFIAVIESGDMPKGGLQVSDGELKTLKQWVAQGAKFDGKNKQQPFIKPGTGDSSQNARTQRGQRGTGGRRGTGGGSRLQAVEQNPQAVGAEGVAWYTTWDAGLAEAKRSNRPIFFMSAAAQCTGVSGVF